ncbi:hypothetical protein ABT026_32055 [Streptomyces sp. NPDC002734]|uniref:hypothetical protein n=1 Tax=Streptomyces sp. NPDC002734 TaxID=3154426 RepID=UPI0033219259
MSKKPRYPDASPEGEETARHFVQQWAEAVIRQAHRTRQARNDSAANSRAYDLAEDFSPPTEQLETDFRTQWAEEHLLVWCAHQLERWRARLAHERGEDPPAENPKLKLVRDSLEHLDEAAFTLDAARSPAPEGGPGRALRGLPEQQLRLQLGGRDLFEVLDAERLDEEALKVVRSIEDELGERAAAAYHDLLGGH